MLQEITYGFQGRTLNAIVIYYTDGIRDTRPGGAIGLGRREGEKSHALGDPFT